MKSKITYLALLLTLYLFYQSGCTRKIDPDTADAEVRKLLEDVPGYDWFPGPNSRLAFSRENRLPEAPRDDSASRQITLRIQKKDAYADGNESSILSNDRWGKQLSLDANISLPLDLATSVKLALLHSRDFQLQKESLYLSALDVTYERFKLGPVPFAGVSGDVTQLVDDDASDFSSRAKAGFRGVTGKGTSWITSLANRLSIELSGGDVNVGGSLANLTLTQPLLRGASRRIYLERLTQSERNLLADARSLEQFRKGFFLEIVAGVNPASGPSRKMGISPVSPPSSNVSGFLGLVQDLQRIRNQEANVAKLNDSLAQLKAAFEAGRIGNRLQVDQARQALFNGQSRLLAAKSAYENRLDGYKLFLGLPPNVALNLVDDYIEDFKLSDPGLVKLQDKVSQILASIRDPQKSDSLESLLVSAKEIQDSKSEIDKSLKDLEVNLNKFQNAIPQRKATFEKLRKRKDLRQLGMSLDTFKDSQVEELHKDLDSTYKELVKSMLAIQDEINAWIENSNSSPLDIARGRISVIVNRLSGSLLELSLTMASARLESIVMKEITIVPKKAFTVAAQNRLDWKNNRAKLVDIWRQADLAKDDLQTDLDLILSGTLGSDSMGAGQFKADESSLRVGLELDTPLSKVAERNRYKASLIHYQQARRSLLAYEDSIFRLFREHQRLSQLFQLNFELSRAAVGGAIAQVDLARMRLDEPPQPGRNFQFGATTARDLVNALNDLLDASNKFIEVWIGYEALRMRYEYDLGTMELSDQGIWEDKSNF